MDCWAAGVLAYELVVGRPPFEVKDEAKTASAIMYSNDFPLPSKYSAQWAAFVKQACRSLTRYHTQRIRRLGRWTRCVGRSTQHHTHRPDRNNGGSGSLSIPLRGRRHLLQALMKNPALRPSAAQLLEHPWVKQHTARAEAVLLPELDLPALSLSKHDFRYQVLTPPPFVLHHPARDMESVERHPQSVLTSYFLLLTSHFLLEEAHLPKLTIHMLQTQIGSPALSVAVLVGAEVLSLCGLHFDAGLQAFSIHGTHSAGPARGAVDGPPCGPAQARPGQVAACAALQGALGAVGRRQERHQPSASLPSGHEAPGEAAAAICTRSACCLLPELLNEVY